jgi:cytochrome c oxidase subunit 3
MGVTIAPAAHRPSITTVGVAVWLASEVMFFAGLFAAYFALRAANDPWPPRGIHLETARAALFTLVLIASSVTVHHAGVEVERRDHAKTRTWMLVTLVLGIAFLANQFLEWATVDFSVSTNSYGTIYYAMTGFHGLHVAVGLVLLAVVALRPPDLPSSVPGLRQATTWYWHFVDIVWVAVFSTIFIIR